MKIYFCFIDLEVFSCSGKAGGCKNVSTGGKGNSSYGHIICELHNKISLMLAQLSFWHFLKVAINDYCRGIV